MMEYSEQKIIFAKSELASPFYQQKFRSMPLFALVYSQQMVAPAYTKDESQK
jgi:hypothetical protein